MGTEAIAVLVPCLRQAGDYRLIGVRCKRTFRNF
jgi:hypothetical protein